ncbi:D-alanyl-lipoteichoic acid biosynthesis protein DltD [Changchengzhania lutea]|uniref:D-alanyl-lipoteichoic acid biosynthesis protein DltD n=1 Tax=Changchengzhania lutea TaxID=2049305 RepID=UPI00163D5BC6|nr:D-alanyl-lipoteichoic acid biosynthesis protein DltD [Changchengzhania lutea]
MKLVCVGDSLTYGYEVATSKRWTTLLEKNLNVPIVNLGINGDTTTGMLSRFAAALTDYKPTHILIFGGTNDLWFGLNDEFIISNIYAMCKQAKHYDIEFIVGIPSPCFNSTEINFIGENYANRIEGFQKRLKAYCIEKEFDYIDFSKDMIADYFMDDRIHFNEKGHEITMENAKEVIKTFKLKND